MKTLFSFFATAALFLTLNTNGQPQAWVKTGEGQVNCKKISIQKETAKAVLENGEKMVFPLGTITSYYQDNTLFTKMPLATTGLKGENVFLEFIKSREDKSLYKYHDTNFIRYFIYKGDDFYVEVVDNNRKAFEDYFYVPLYQN